MSDVCPFRCDWMGGSMSINLSSLNSPHAPFIIIEVQVDTVSLVIGIVMTLFYTETKPSFPTAV